MGQSMQLGLCPCIHLVLHKCLLICLSLNAAGCWSYSSPNTLPSTVFSSWGLFPTCLPSARLTPAPSSGLHLDSPPFQMAFPDHLPECAAVFLRNSHHRAVIPFILVFFPKYCKFSCSQSLYKPWGQLGDRRGVYPP